MSDALLSPHDALIHVMVLVAGSDREMTDRELRLIGDQVRNRPIFRGFDEEEIIGAAQDCAKMLAGADGLQVALDHIQASLPAELAETAYVLACEIAAADAHLEAEELRMLQILRDRLGLDKLVAAAIERTTRARNMVL
jgi:tellurite resistance protein